MGGERERERETRLSVTPGHFTVQEGLSMVSCRESIIKSKHVLYWKLFKVGISQADQAGLDKALKGENLE